jgi:hypothetical protein
MIVDRWKLVGFVLTLLSQYLTFVFTNDLVFEERSGIDQ